MNPLIEIMRFELDNLPGGIDDVARKFLDTVCTCDTICTNEQED